jgi:chorismate-pyruvate lyase
VSGSKYVTEVALLNVNKEPLVVAKTSTPIKRLGTQVFAVKLDF